MSEFVWVFGQFLDHDISLVKRDPTQYEGVRVPNNDAYFTPGSFLHFFRSLYEGGSGTPDSGPRQFVNEVSAFIDASQVYGSEPERAAWLRTYSNGKLKTSAGGLLPWNTMDHEFNGVVSAEAPSMDDDSGQAYRLMVAGDVRANENPLLIALHVIFVREHNRICDELAQLYPHWDDELLYQSARKWVGAQLQAIVYYEWLPALGIELPLYDTYDPTVDPGILNEFAASAFRMGHTLIADDILRLNAEGDTLSQGNLALKDAFFNAAMIPLSGGVEPFLKGLSTRRQQLLDTRLVDGVRNFLFGAPGAGGLDLATMNIMRGRDRGLPDFNTLRADYGLSKYADLEGINGDPALTDALRFLYGNVDNIDPWVGMLAEPHLPGMMFGELLYTILYRQFLSLRDGDRYYFMNDGSFSPEEKTLIASTRLKDIIERNTSIKGLQDGVFFIPEQEETNPGPPLARDHLDAVAYPNPVRDRLYLKYYLSEDTGLTLTVMDALGRRVITQETTGREGENIAWLELRLPTGFYMVMLESRDTFRLFRVRVEN